MAAIEKLLGKTVKNTSGEDVMVSTFCGADKVVGLYFSAHWCPPCRGFTPKLVEFYKKMQASGKKFEVVFISSDRDPKQFQEYFDSMPWLALEFTSEERGTLGATYNVRGIPTLILLDGETGEVICREARNKVDTDSNGVEFPWK